MITPPTQLRRWGLMALSAAAALVLITALLRAATPPPPEPDVQRLDTATVATHIGGQHTQGETRLPYLWDNRHQGQAGSAEFQLSFDHDLTSDNVPALYIPRLGNAYEITVNGYQLDSAGDLERYNGSDYAKQPLLRQLPLGILQERDNRLHIRIRADVGRRGGLSSVYVGPHDSLRPLYTFDYRWRVMGSEVVVMLSVFFAAIGVALWASQLSQSGQSGRDPLYGFLVLAELAWAVRVCDALIDTPPLPWPYWGMLQVYAVAIWASALTYFFAVLGTWQRLPAWQHLRWWLGALQLLGLLASWLALEHGHARALTLWYGLLILGFLGLGLLNLWRIAHSNAAQRLLMGSLLINVLVGLRDLYTFRIDPGMGTNTLTRYSVLLFGFSLAVVAVMRFRAVTQRAQGLTDTLNQRVAERENELALSYARLETLAREQASASERARILRDMHDGVGMHLSTAIRLLRSDNADRTELLRTLTDSMDQLKLSIDALQTSPGDVATLLAALRYRLEPRLRAGGLELQWVVDELPPVNWLDAQGTRNLQFLLFEAISNSLQHAHATLLTVSARCESGQLHIVIADNGQGFDTTRPSSRGLQALRERASAIHARLDLVSDPGGGGGTRVALALPLERPATGPIQPR